jgi:hypothetical protein
VVTGPSENRVDFGVDQLVLQHGTLAGAGSFAGVPIFSGGKTS